MITLLLNKYYISTTITITNQSYHTNAYYIFIRLLSRFLDFGFNDFIGLKNTPVAVGPHGPMLNSERNSPKGTRA